MFSFCFVIFLGSFIWIIDTTIGLTDSKYYNDEEELIWYNSAFTDTKCLFTKEDDALFNGDNITFPEDSIYFIETSCNGGLDFRQACSVESAARAHPLRQVNVLFAGRDGTEDIVKQNTLKALHKYKNIKLFKIHLKEYVKGTPLEELVQNSLNKSLYLLHHTSDVLRFITLYKFGGIYLDLDVITVKSFDYLPVKKNFIGRNDDRLAVGIVGVVRNGVGKQLIDAIIRNLKHHFNPMEWAANGIDITEYAVNQVCSSNWDNISSDKCKDFKIYDTRHFYSVASENYFEFSLPYIQTLNLTKIYAYHLWNYLLFEDPIHKESLHSLLSKKYCPEVDKVNSVGYKHRLPGTYPYPIKTFRVERTKDKTTINQRYKREKSKISTQEEHNAFEMLNYSDNNANDKYYKDINDRATINAFKRTRWMH